MILLVHMIFGAAIGSLSGNVYVGMIFALASHYFLDLFPHIEYLESTEDSIKRKSSKDITWVTMDLLLGIGLIYLLSKNAGPGLLYGFAAIIPDGLTVATHLFPNTLLKKHHQIHSGPIHYLTKQKKFPIFWKIFSQIAAVLIAYFLLALAL